MADTPQDQYTIKPGNWYQSLPYGFAFYGKDTGKGAPAKKTVWLPIAPNNLQITTPMATNIITTLYGIVEEHSEIRYHDIVITGTTGMMPKYIGYPEDNKQLKDISSPGRTSFELGHPAYNFPFLGGFIEAVGNLVEATENGPKNKTGTNELQTGYYAFHKLYQFFLAYKADTAGEKPTTTATQTPKRKRHPLTFLNYKDNTQYDCTPVTFNMVRSVDDPMLYNYTIILKAYNLKTISSNEETDAFLADAARFGIGVNDKEQPDFSDIADIAGRAGALLGGF